MFVHYVVHTNRCFCDAFASANIWLYHVLHDNLHCLVFKEHPWFSLEAFEKLFRESASIWYLSAFALSRRILNFFFEACGFIRSLLSAVLCSRCLPPTCIILHAFGGDVNTFLKKFFDFFQCTQKPPRGCVTADLSWWRHRDLNSGHCGYEPHALANWAMPPVVGRDGFEPS